MRRVRGVSRDVTGHDATTPTAGGGRRMGMCEWIARRWRRRLRWLRGMGVGRRVRQRTVVVRGIATVSDLPLFKKEKEKEKMFY